MVNLYLDAGRHLLLHIFRKLLLERIFAIAQSKFAPAERSGAVKHDADNTGDLAIRLDLQIGNPQHVRRLIHRAGGQNEGRTFIYLPDALGGGVLPMQSAELGIAFAGVEERLFARYLDDSDLVVQLTHIQVVGYKEVVITVGYIGHVSLETGSARQANEEARNFIPIAAFLCPDVRRRLDLDAERLVFFAAMLAREGRIFNRHDCAVDFLQFLDWRVRRTDHPGRDAREFARIHKPVYVLRPVLPLGGPVFIGGSGNRVIEKRAIGIAVHRRHIVLLGVSGNLRHIQAVGLVRGSVNDLGARRQIGCIRYVSLHNAAVTVLERALAGQEEKVRLAGIQRAL